jgi:hypothetical protein
MNCKILVDAPQIPNWKLKCIDLLKNGNAVEVCEVGSDVGRERFRSLRRLLGGKALRAAPISTNGSSSAPCDLVVDLRTNVVANPAPLGRAPYWFFCDGDGGALGDLPGAREICAGSPTFTIELRSWNGASSAAVRCGTFKSLYSYARSMEVALEECSRWPALALNVRLALGRLPESPRAPGCRDAPRVSPFALLARLAWAFIAHVYVHLFVDARWSVGLIRGSPGSFLSESYRPQIDWLRERDRSSEFLADPFVFGPPERRCILGERVDRTTQTGFITCLVVEDGGNVLEERVVMRSSSHLSYPYVFAHSGAWYMVPESAQERRVALYRALDVPYRWERVATLIDGVATCDNTILRHDGLWWLFCTHKARDSNLNLFLYHARDLLGPWKAHVANPVKTDVRSSRPAGMPFIADGRLYRPAQDCAKAYGDAIVFSRITALNEHEFSEELVSTFRRDAATRDSHGAHTMSYSEGIMAIDSKKIIFASPTVIGRRLGKLATRVLSPAT